MRRACRPARRARARASPPAPCGGARSPRARAPSAPPAARAPRRRSTTSAESTFGSGWKTVRGTLRENAHLAGELGEHRGGAVGLRAGRRGEPLAHLALHHRDPELRVGQLVDRLEQHGRRDAVRAGSRRPCPGGGSSVAKSSSTASARCSVAFSNGVERLAQRRLERAVDLDHVQVRHARREVLRQHAEPAADLEHDVGRVELRRARRSRRRMLSSIRKFWPSSRFGRIAELAQAAEAGLARLAHQSEARARRCASTVRSSSLVVDAAQLGHEARRVRRRSPARSACRAPAAATGTASRSRPAAARPGTLAGGLLEVGRLRVGHVAGERAEVAALDALVEPVGRGEAVQDHGGQSTGVLAQQREGVVLRRAGVDHDREPRAARPARAAPRTRAAGRRAGAWSR